MTVTYIAEGTKTYYMTLTYIAGGSTNILDDSYIHSKW